MNGVSLKTILIIFILLIFILLIRNNLINKQEESVSTEEQEIVDNTENLISNNLRIGIVEFDNINPILSNNKNVQDISRLIFEPLFTLTQDYKLKPSLAKEWTRLDAQTYLIKLREDIKWQNDEKFDSSDVIFTIDMLKKLETKSVYFYNVKNISAIEEIDEYTFKIVTDSEIPYFEYNLIFPIMSSKYYNENNFELESKNINPVGTGMFYISNTENNTILLKKSINEWNELDTKIDTITLKLYNSLSSVIDAYKTGEIDLFTTSNRNIENYLKNVKYNKVEYINRNYEYMVLNCKNDILSNTEVRQAINSSINKEEILKDIYSNKQRISNFPLDFGNYAYDTNNNHIAYDQNTAKRLLVDNGWKYSSKKWSKIVKKKYLKIELELVVKKSDNNLTKVANKIKEQLDNVGIRIKVIEVNDKKYNEYIKNKKYDMIMVDSTYSYSPSLVKYFQDGNLANYENEEIKNIISEVKNEADENIVKEKYTRIVNIYNEEVPYISLFFNENTIIYADELKGNITPNSYNLFYGIENWNREYKNNK